MFLVFYEEKFLSTDMLLVVGSFGGMFEALQGIFDARFEHARTKFFQKSTPPTWWEREVSAIAE
jgi:hypothetical protein